MIDFACTIAPWRTGYMGKLVIGKTHHKQFATKTRPEALDRAFEYLKHYEYQTAKQDSTAK